MLDIGWSELLVIGVVALIVVGPKDLPVLFRRMGEFTGKARAMAREFSSAMEKAADEAGVKDVQKDLRNIANPRKMGLDAINEATRGLSDWDDHDDFAGAKPSTSAPAAKTEVKTGAEATSGRDTGNAKQAAKPAASGDAGDTIPAAAAIREAAAEAGFSEAGAPETEPPRDAKDEKTA